MEVATWSRLITIRQQLGATPGNEQQEVLMDLFAVTCDCARTPQGTELIERLIDETNDAEGRQVAANAQCGSSQRTQEPGQAG